MEVGLENNNPDLYDRKTDRIFTLEDFHCPNAPYDKREIFDYIRDIKDPEHPLSLEELGIVDIDLIQIKEDSNTCFVQFKPTIPHCSMATLIGLAIKVQLLRILPTYFKVEVCIPPGYHNSFNAINKQLSDKERIAAALENQFLLSVINDCLLLAEPQTLPAFIENALKEENILDHPKITYIRLCRQNIETYRRWKDIIHSKKNKCLSALNYST